MAWSCPDRRRPSALTPLRSQRTKPRLRLLSVERGGGKATHKNVQFHLTVQTGVLGLLPMQS